MNSKIHLGKPLSDHLQLDIDNLRDRLYDMLVDHVNGMVKFHLIRELSSRVGRRLITVYELEN